MQMSCNLLQTESPQLYGLLWQPFSFSRWVFTDVSNIMSCPVFVARPKWWPHLTAQLPVGSRLLMKPGHSIPKIQGLCNWSGSTVCPCESKFVCCRNCLIMQQGWYFSCRYNVVEFQSWCAVDAKHAHAPNSLGPLVNYTEATCNSPWSGLQTESRLNVHQAWPQPDCVTHQHTYWHTCTHTDCSDDNTRHWPMRYAAVTRVQRSNFIREFVGILLCGFILLATNCLLQLLFSH